VSGLASTFTVLLPLVDEPEQALPLRSDQDQPPTN